MKRQLWVWSWVGMLSVSGLACTDSSNGGSGVETGGEVEAISSGAEQPGTPFLRRMPASTYGNALRDLFEGILSPDDLADTGPLPLALELNNFDNNAAVDVASPTLVEAYHNRAVSVSEFLYGELEDHFGVETR